MSARIAAALLRLAARRWPSADRAELLREWTAELHAAESGWSRLTFATSLAASSMNREYEGVRDGAYRRRWPVPAVLLVGFLLSTTRPPFDSTDTAEILRSAAVLLVAAALGWVAGRVSPFAATGRFGAYRSAVLAPIVLLPFWLPSLPWVIVGSKSHTAKVLTILLAAGVYGLTAARRTKAAAAPSVPQPAAVTAPVDEPRRVPPAVTVVGAAAVLSAVFAWAYAFVEIRLAPFAPELQEVVWNNDGAPYTWAAELRAAAIFLGTLGVVVLTANRRFAARAALVFAAVLYVGDWSLAAADIADERALTLCLAVGAAATGVAWWASGPPLTDVSWRIGRRLRAVALPAVLLGPLLLTSGQDPDEVAALPQRMYVVAGVLAVLLAGLGIAAALASMRRRIARPWMVLLAAAPFAVGAGTLLIDFAAIAFPLVGGIVVLLGLPPLSRAKDVGVLVASLVSPPVLIYGALLLGVLLPRFISLRPGQGEEGLSFAMPIAYLALLIAVRVSMVGVTGTTPAPAAPQGTVAPRTAES